MERGGWVLEIVEGEKRERMKGGGGGGGMEKRNRKRSW